MPDPHAFTDFEITGLTWNKGYTFTNSAGQNLFFPAGGALNSNSGALVVHGSRGFYWTSGTSVQGGQLGYVNVSRCSQVLSIDLKRKVIPILRTNTDLVYAQYKQDNLFGIDILEAVSEWQTF